ncbi:tudor and KH domain-containing protein homolog [Nylanderia fulva]|uniref:tudor and KH domain-containing protein homolog n=1 Tax=Nylanderia fulva TaxID=613905 RepID=UPI0010FB7265|nr:tudor and KH domain-containing protein homolog [Nylanderia fulva]XP_029163811.1 tudor and KH domain-containing protein homolog [Nylanderia fulva]XP_029163812.1 tudor and KH domain-containing protein homolog [Nylanderia fulva]XP_029163813.1 tudor and KH domain-containing protein homolog [Nylanderia fulva]XP_029163814.1 tudor and KH domain-containing protein homolog [Nylanderia fulva]
MKWISNLDRKFVVPILLGISLTTLGCVSLAILYSAFEKDDETRDDNDDTRSRQIVTSRCTTTLQYKVPKQYAAAVIGRGGSVIKDIQDKTGTHIHMNKDDIDSPYRLCIIQGKEMEDIRLAESMIKNIIENQPIIETYELLVPYEACGIILRKSANTVQEIQRSSGAKLILETGAHKSEAGWKKRIVIKGTAEQIALAVTQIEDKIREENEAQAQLKCEQTAIARAPRLSPSKNTVKDTMDDQLIESYELSVPHKACGRIIGKNGNTIQQIQKVSGAEIVVEKNVLSRDDERRVLIRGTAKQIELAVTQINNKVREENETRIDLNDKLATVAKETSLFELSFNDNVNVNLSDISEISLSDDDVTTMEVYVSAVETPNVFWIHVVGPGNTALDDLVSKMTEYYNKEENREFHILKKVTVGQMVAAKFSCDNKWYRAEVIDIIKDSYEIYFVDYGDLEVLSIDNVLELRTDMLSLRYQAVECSLANVKPRESVWSSEACDTFAELVHVAQWKSLTAKVKGYKERPLSYGKSHEGFKESIPCIELYDKNKDGIINIRNTLIELNIAQFEEEASLTMNSTLLPDKHDLQMSSALSSSSTEHFSNDCRGEADFTASNSKNYN